ncbi:DUF4156 domain-containing protein [Arenimonas terrae]|jgi:hypothetical protein|uniref:DUF4156 domain-containing protein n=1 Tax=Arenimonas terrae TaxID=2546226 RepID=A0A5C4RPI1_9GAMM|nr:DUF4156 domain-containing protein [Arenimonas terrae]
MRTLATALLLIPLVTACTWVKMAPGGSEVRVARAGQDMSVCEKRGEVSVSVKNRLGPYERNDIKVRDELETLARNEAPGLQADTVQPKGEPVDGEQRFLAFRCGSARPGTAAGTPSAGSEPGTVNPIED